MKPTSHYTYFYILFVVFLTTGFFAKAANNNHYTTQKTLTNTSYKNGPNLEITGILDGDHIYFEIVNIGADMVSSMPYFIFEDNLMLGIATIQLNHDETYTIEEYIEGNIGNYTLLIGSSNATLAVASGYIENTKSSFLDNKEKDQVDKAEVTVDVYPNPFIDYVNFEITESNYDKLILHVFDQTGRLVKTIQTREQTFRLSGTNFSAGLYVYHLLGDGEVIKTGKLAVK